MLRSAVISSGFSLLPRLLFINKSLKAICNNFREQILKREKVSRLDDSFTDLPNFIFCATEWFSVFDSFRLLGKLMPLSNSSLLIREVWKTAFQRKTGKAMGNTALTLCWSKLLGTNFGWLSPSEYLTDCTKNKDLKNYHPICLLFHF